MRMDDGVDNANDSVYLQSEERCIYQVNLNLYTVLCYEHGTSGWFHRHRLNPDKNQIKISLTLKKKTKKKQSVN